MAKGGGGGGGGSGGRSGGGAEGASAINRMAQGYQPEYRDKIRQILTQRNEINQLRARGGLKSRGTLDSFAGRTLSSFKTAASTRGLNNQRQSSLDNMIATGSRVLSSTRREVGG